MTMLEYFDTYCQEYRPYKGGAWCYEDGCIYRGLELLFEATGDRRWLDHLLRLTDAQILPDGGLRGYAPDEFNIDHILAGRVLFFLLRHTRDRKYQTAADALSEQLAAHPRTATGNYWHKNVYPHQVWLDGLYMGLPFQIEYGQLSDRPALVADAIAQLRKALDLTATGGGLYAHGYDEARLQGWADPQTGHSPSHWARALGWLAMALVDSCALLEPSPDRRGLQHLTENLLERIVSLRTENGLWLQVIDQPDLVGNYEETSASAMFAYALMRAGRLGLNVDPGRTGQYAFEALAAARLNADETTGKYRFGGICQVAGLGGFSGVYRDGTPEYYLREPVVYDDAKGVGPMMMAQAEFLKVRRDALRSA